MPLALAVAPTSQPVTAAHYRQSGVYLIRCVPTGKVYVGSAVRLGKRCYEHRRTLAEGTHPNPYLLYAWCRYGADAFEFSVLEFVAPDWLVKVEQRYIEELCAVDRSKGFNLNPVAGSNLGRRYGPETRAKISAARRGKALSAEHRAKISAAALGNKSALGLRHSPETLARIAETSRGRRPALGMRHSLATKARLSEMNRGKILSAEHRAKIAAALRGERKTESHRKRLSEVQAMFSPEQTAEIRWLYRYGLRMQQISNRFRCSRSTISNVINGKRAVYQWLL